MSNYPRFHDFSEEDRRLEGGKVKISDVVNKEILVTGFLVGKSRYNNEKSEQKEYLTLEFKFGEEGEKHILFTGSDVLISQIQKYKENIPFYAVIKQIDRYYTFT